MPQIKFEIPEEMIYRLRVRAAQTRMTRKNFVIEALAEKLKIDPKTLAEREAAWQEGDLG